MYLHLFDAPSRSGSKKAQLIQAYETFWSDKKSRKETYVLQAKTKKLRVHNEGLNFTEHSLHLSTYDMRGQVSAWFHAPRRVALAILFPRQVASRLFLLEQEKEKKWKSKKAGKKRRERFTSHSYGLLYASRLYKCTIAIINRALYIHWRRTIFFVNARMRVVSLRDVWSSFL